MPVFLAVTLVPAFGLVWLGWALLEQDRALETQRRRERIDLSASSAVAALEQRIAGIERQLAGRSPIHSITPGSGAVAVTFGREGVTAAPPGGLVFHPWVAAEITASGAPFEAAEALEFRGTGYRQAEAAYRELTHSPDPAIRAGAQLRLARVLRKAGQTGAALAAFEALARFETVRIDGTPAGLLAGRARCALLAESKRTTELRREAEALYAALQSGRWKLTGAAYRIHLQDTREWSGQPAVETEAESLAAAAEWLWQRWQQTSDAAEPAIGRLTYASPEGNQTTILWALSDGRMRAFLASRNYVREHWLKPVNASLAPSGVTIRLAEPAEPKAAAQRTARESGMPWNLAIDAVEGGEPAREFATRRRLLLTGLVLILLLVAAGSYFVGRSVAREIAVARLQSEFVSAVSHEFRTPLTSLRQFTEILADKRVPEERRETYYLALSRATQRLHRLVEDLLDFGRIEAGGSGYQFAPVDAAEFVRETVEAFQAEAAGRGYTVELDVRASGIIEADREPLTRALWNLLDNAVKYSPTERTVWVELDRTEDRAVIRVRDRGLGVTPEEREAIFGKFVRGSSAKRVEGKGTGIGLAMVRHIVAAHGGRIEVESRPGEGSTFCITLPVRSE